MYKIANKSSPWNLDLCLHCLELLLQKYCLQSRNIFVLLNLQEVHQAAATIFLERGRCCLCSIVPTMHWSINTEFQKGRHVRLPAPTHC